METVEIAKTEYDELRARPEQRQLEEANERAAKAEKDLESAETAQKAAEKDRDDLKTKVNGFEEKARQATLADERLGKLGAGFMGKLGEKTKQRLRSQAATLSDDEYTARLEELEELTKAKRDDGAKNGGGGGEHTFTPEEIARHNGGGGNGDQPPDQTINQRRSVLAGLSSAKR